MLRRIFFLQKNLEYNFIRNLRASDVPCRNSSFCKNAVGLSEKLFETGEADEFIFAPTEFLAKTLEFIQST